MKKMLATVVKFPRATLVHRGRPTAEEAMLRDILTLSDTEDGKQVQSQPLPLSVASSVAGLLAALGSKFECEKVEIEK